MEFRPLAFVAAWRLLETGGLESQVLCPFCGDCHIHRRGQDRYLHLPSDWKEQALCLISTLSNHTNSDINRQDQRSEYRLVFPGNNNFAAFHLSCEIDEQHGVFQTIGLHSTHASKLRIIIGDGKDDLASMVKNLELTEKLVVNSSNKHQISKKAARLRDEFFRSIEQSNIVAIVNTLSSAKGIGFLSAKDAAGRTPVFVACGANGSLTMIKILLGYLDRAEINNANDEGRTPLMEAILWGHGEIAFYLIENGAATTCTDKSGRMVAGFVEDNNQNNDERERRHPGFDNNFQRRQFRRLLLPYLGIQRSDLNVHILDASHSFDWCRSMPKNQQVMFSLRKTSNVHKIQVPSTKGEKTPAVLHRGHPFPDVVTLSGYTNERDDKLITVYGLEHVNSYRWTEAAQSIAQMLGLPTAPSVCSHSEQQLMAYFIVKHAGLTGSFQLSLKNMPKALFEKSRMFLDGVLRSMPRSADIIVWRQPCVYCQEFQRRVEQHYNIKFNVTY